MQEHELGVLRPSWRDMPSPDAGRIVGSNLRLGHLQGGSSTNALQERVCIRRGQDETSQRLRGFLSAMKTGLPAAVNLRS